jgi:hypothetical protein
MTSLVALCQCYVGAGPVPEAVERCLRVLDDGAGESLQSPNELTGLTPEHRRCASAYPTNVAISSRS